MPKKFYHVYADANIYLDFFRFTDDDLTQLEKFAEHIEASGVEVYLPQITAEEYFRNRDKVISEQILSLQRFSLKVGVPVCARELDEAKELVAKLKETAAIRDALLQEVEALASSHSFKADTLIESLFAKAQVVATTGDLVNRAKIRSELGNPPGKPAALGDRLNWEALLATVPDGNDLHLITRDSDYLADFKSRTANQFLLNEWAARKKGKIRVHANIKSFATHVDNTIQFATDTQRKEAIEALASSISYSGTHHAIGHLTEFWGKFTDDDCERLLNIALENSQVSDIIHDPDVHDFYYHVRNRLPWSGNEIGDIFDEHFDGIAVPF